MFFTMLSWYLNVLRAFRDRTYFFLNTYVQRYIHTCIYKDMYARMYIYIYIYIHTYVYTYIDIIFLYHWYPVCASSMQSKILLDLSTRTHTSTCKNTSRYYFADLLVSCMYLVCSSLLILSTCMYIHVYVYT